MATYIFSHSNTLKGPIWVDNFKRKSSDAVFNQSIGATTTLAAMFRFLASDTPAEGDNIIWEYALNEVHHAKRMYELENLLANLERFIVMCRDRSCKFSALIFTPRSEEQAAKRHDYFDKITDLFKHYGITFFDVSLEYRKAFRVDRMPAVLIADFAHYAADPDLSDFIADHCLENIQLAERPHQVSPVYIPDGQVTLLNNFCSEKFQNSIMRIPAQSLPIEFKMGQAGRLIGIMAICPAQGDMPEESGVSFRILKREYDDQRFRFSTTRKKKDINRPILKAICLDNLRDRNWVASEGDIIKMNHSSGKGMYYAEFGMAKKIQNPVKNPNVLIAGVLIETAK